MKKALLAFLLVVFTISLAWAIPVQKVRSTKRNKYHSRGVFIGGESELRLHLIDIKYKETKRKRERFTLEIGGRDPEKKLKRPGYFHLIMNGPRKQMVLDLENLQASFLTEEQIIQAFLKSQYVKEANVSMDPVDQSTNISLKFKTPVRVEIFERRVSKKPAAIVIDLKKARVPKKVKGRKRRAS